MSKYIVAGKKKPLKGEITVPGDKSISHRAIILSSIAKGKSYIKGLLEAKDVISTINAFKTLGITIQLEEKTWVVEGKGLHGLSAPTSIIDAGNSGTTARLLLGLLSAQNFQSTITGDKYLKKRPMKRVVEPLKMMEAKIVGNYGDDNTLPLTITGSKLRSIKYTLPVASAQVKSALILAGLYAEGVTQITEPVKTRDHTERMLKHLGVKLDISNNTIKVSPPPQFKGTQFVIPSDISSASFFIVSALINPGSEVLIKNVGLNPLRTGIIEILKKMNADIQILDRKEECGEPVGSILVKSSELVGTEIGGDMIPKAIDELPIIAVAACFAKGETVIKDAKELRVKETDRIKAMTTELKKMGADIEETEDGMIIHGKEHLRGGRCYSWGDHRVAMSIAVAASAAIGDTTIEDPNVVSISFPNFFVKLERLRNLR